MSDVRVELGPAPVGRVPERVTVVVPVRNGAPTIAEQLDALAGQALDHPWELVVADNGSTDSTVAVVEREVADRRDATWDSVRVVDASAVPGSAHARNAGVAAAGGDLLCFCDADDVVEPGWLAALVRVAADHHLVGGRLDTETLNSAQVRSWRPAPRATVSDTPSFAPSGNCAIWADVYAALGGFDESFLKSHDVELSKRARAAGADLGFAPEAVVRYRLRSTLRGLAHQAFRAGRATVQLAAEHPGQEPPVTARRVLARIGWSLSRSPYLLVASRRGTWVRVSAEGAGLVAGLWATRGPTGRRRR